MSSSTNCLAIRSAGEFCLNMLPGGKGGGRGIDPLIARFIPCRRMSAVTSRSNGSTKNQASASHNRSAKTGARGPLGGGPAILRPRDAATPGGRAVTAAAKTVAERRWPDLNNAASSDERRSAKLSTSAFHVASSAGDGSQPPGTGVTVVGAIGGE